MKIPFWSTKAEAENESYDYFDKNIRKLPRNSEGKIDIYSAKLWNNDVDAFRHAYVSGVFTQKYDAHKADVFGRFNEVSIFKDPENELNMDLWNNYIGRIYGMKTKQRTKLAKLLKEALEKRELIITPTDTRKYKGASIRYIFDPNKPVIALEEEGTGRNKQFLDLETEEIMSLEEFVIQIEMGKYPGYTLAVIDEIKTPMSKPDMVTTNNLG